MFLARCLSTAAMVACLAAVLPAQAPAPDAALDEKIVDLLVLTGAVAQSRQVLDGMIGSMKALAPEVPDSLWSMFMDEFGENAVHAIALPVYRRNFTVEEIDGMLAFYRSPVGRSILDKMPVVIGESMAAGEEWGQRTAEILLLRIEAEGYRLRTQP